MKQNMTTRNILFVRLKGLGIVVPTFALAQAAPVQTITLTCNATKQLPPYENPAPNLHHNNKSG
jgi:hypothetical protein